MKKKKLRGNYELKIKADGVPICDVRGADFSDIEKSFEKAKNKLK